MQAVGEAAIARVQAAEPAEAAAMVATAVVQEALPEGHLPVGVLAAHWGPLVPRMRVS